MIHFEGIIGLNFVRSVLTQYYNGLSISSRFGADASVNMVENFFAMPYFRYRWMYMIDRNFECCFPDMLG